MINEHLANQNVFGIFGGVRSIPEVRDGLIRASGVFQHSILAGCFGATLLPLFLAVWPNRKDRKVVLVGIVSSAIIVVTANGSTASLAFCTGIVALCLWPIRKHMQFVRWGLVLVLIALHFVMHGPVWSLIEKVDLTGSSSSYHRYILVDNCIRHFSDWWFLGVKNYQTWGFDMWDLSNQYVAYAFTGGLVTLFFFVAIIVRSFAGVGAARKRAAGHRGKEWFFWCLGAAVFAHVVAYFGIGYFDQTEFAWFALLAIICAAISETQHAIVHQVEMAAQSNYPLALAMNLGRLETGR
jgi:hypothetical protein